MQSFSPLVLAQADDVVPPVPNPSAPAWKLVSEAHGSQAHVAFALLSIAAGFAAIWVASRIFAGPDGTLGRAVKVWFAGLGIGVVVGAGLYFGVPIAARSGAVAGLVVMGVLACAALAGLIGIPMAVYGIGLARSVGFTVVCILLNGAMSFGLQHAFLGRAPGFEPAMLSQLMPAPPPDPAQVEAARSQLRERQAALARRHEALEIRRRHLPVGDAQERADYEREKEAYERDLESLRAEASALPVH